MENPGVSPCRFCQPFLFQPGGKWRALRHGIDKAGGRESFDLGKSFPRSKGADWQLISGEPRIDGDCRRLKSGTRAESRICKSRMIEIEMRRALPV